MSDLKITKHVRLMDTPKEADSRRRYTEAQLEMAIRLSRADALEEAANPKFLRPLVEEQAKGEWDDKTIDEDVAAFSAAIRALGEKKHD